MAGEEATEVAEQTEAGGDHAEGSENDTTSNDGDEGSPPAASMEDVEEIGEILQQVQKKGGRSTRDILHDLVKRDPEAAHVVRSLYQDYSRKRTNEGEAAKKMADERAAIEKARRDHAEEVRRFQDAVLKSRLGQRAEVAQEEPLGDVDYAQLLSDPAAYTKRVIEETRRAVLSELPKALEPHLKPFEEFSSNIRLQAAKLNVERIKQDHGEHWAGMKPHVDKLLEENETLDFMTAVRLARGMYFEELHSKNAQVGQAADRARAESQRVAGRGTGGKAPLTGPRPSSPNGNVSYQDVLAWVDQGLAAGYTHDELNAFLRAQKNAR